MSSCSDRSPDALIAASGLPRAEARLLLEQASGQRREWLLAHGDEALEDAACERFLSLKSRRQNGEPIAYLCGEREFHGLAFQVDPAVLIPRPETELLVDEAARRAPSGASVLDLGTGSGAIAIALAVTRPDLRLIATDQSVDALALARANAHRHQLTEPRVAFRQGSWWQAIGSSERFALIVSNPPYIADRDPHLDQGDLRFEPHQALASGIDGLDALRAIIADAPAYLQPDGWLLLEHGWDQGQAVRALLARAGFEAIQTLRDLADHDRISIGRRTENDRRPRVV